VSVGFTRGYRARFCAFATPPILVVGAKKSPSEQPNPIQKNARISRFLENDPWVIRDLSVRVDASWNSRTANSLISLRLFTLFSGNSRF
jgi:hypothetical protein